MHPHQWLAAAVLTVLCIDAPAAAAVRAAATGVAEFHMSCAVCHGKDAHGDGPLAKLLTVAPTDLTRLAKRHGGAFPTEMVAEAIDGRTRIDAHGTRDMPVWGTRYEAQVGREYGPYGSESVVKTRIEVLVRYLKSIQAK